MKQKAFTLIELLVVIAIIAILAAILFPVFAQAKQAAKKTSRLSDMKQMAIGAKLYQGDSDDVIVMPWGMCVDGEQAGPEFNNCSTTNRREWASRLLPYIKNNDLFVDKNGPRVFPRDMSLTANFGSRPNMAMNYYVQSNNVPLPETAVERPSQMILFAGTGTRDWFGNGVLVGAADALNPWDWTDIWGGMDAADGSRRSQRCVQYHTLGDAWMMNHYDPQLPWSLDMRYTGGTVFPHVDGSAKFYKGGQLQPENFYAGNEDPANPWKRGRANCGD